MYTRNNAGGAPWRAALLITLALGAGVLAGSRTYAQGRTPLVRLTGHLPSPLALQRKIGAAPADAPVQLALTLPLRNQAELSALIGRLYDPRDPQYGHFLSAEEFQTRFSPTEAQYRAVAAFAQSQGLAITGVHPNRLLLEVAGPAARVEQAFSTRLSLFQAIDGRLVRVPETEPAVPAALAGSLTGVVGLDNLAVRRSHLRRKSAPAVGARAVAQATGSGPGGGLTPSDIRTAYNLSGSSLDGSGQTLGLFELDGYNSSDIATYERTFGVGPVTLQNVLVSGVGGQAGSGADEVTLDIELQIALAPGASKIMVYEGPNTNAGVLATYNRIATDNVAKSISTSWGLAETQSSTSILSSEASIFQQMAAQGQSIFAAAGDAGAYDDLRNLSVDDPASQPYVTGVGGTTLTTSGAGGSYVSESTWNDGSPSNGAGGGGISRVWALPSYQSGVATSANHASSTARNVPDVALNADPDTGYAIYSGGQWVVFGGTSCTSPLWAAFTALVNQQRTVNGSAPVGFLNPTLYSLGKAQQSADFHDVADGSTNLFYPATPGYDDATGWGSFKGSSLLADLAGTGSSGGASGPTLTNCTATPASLAATGGTVTVSVDVASNSALSSVVATATPTAGAAVTVSLSRVDSSSTFTGALTLPASTAAAAVSYTVVIRATDNAGNASSVNCGTVTVAARDTAGPVFTSCNVTPASLTSAGGAITLSARASDVSGVTSIEAVVTGGGATTVALTADALGTYTGTLVLPANTTASVVTYTVVFRGTDNFGNVTAVTWGSVRVAAGDATPPVIRSCKVSPASLTAAGGVVTITASVTDNGAVDTVAATIAQPDGTESHLTLKLSSGTTYSATFTAPANTSTTAQTYSVTIRAMDSSGNSASAVCGPFTVAAAAPDRTRPSISHCRLSPTTLGAAGGAVTITATVTDNVGVASVTATIKKPNGSTDTVALVKASGSTWSAVYTVPANTTRSTQRYRVTLIAADAAVNTRTVTCGTISVRRP